MELVAVGPWGGATGNKWEVKGYAHLSVIVVAHGSVIDSLTITTIVSDGKKECSPKFGGNGGDHIDKIVLQPYEFLTSIEGHYGIYQGEVVVTSLTFIGNHAKYGPYGQRKGTSFSLPISCGTIVGFHGYASKYLDAIGVYLKPFKPEPSSSNNNAHCIEIKKKSISRLPSLWGGIGGRPWDDGLHDGIRSITVWINKNDWQWSVLSSIQIEYDNDGKVIRSPVHGTDNWPIIETIKIDHPNEFLISVEGFYAPFKSSRGYEIITSLTFSTNKRKVGPFGGEIGTFFTFKILPGKFGICGRSGFYLDALGVRMEQ